MTSLNAFLPFIHTHTLQCHVATLANGQCTFGCNPADNVASTEILSPTSIPASAVMRDSTVTSGLASRTTITRRESVYMSTTFQFPEPPLSYCTSSTELPIFRTNPVSMTTVQETTSISTSDMTIHPPISLLLQPTHSPFFGEPIIPSITELHATVETMILNMTTATRATTIPSMNVIIETNTDETATFGLGVIAAIVAAGTFVAVVTTCIIIVMVIVLCRKQKTKHALSDRVLPERNSIFYIGKLQLVGPDVEFTVIILTFS